MRHSLAQRAGEAAIGGAAAQAAGTKVVEAIQQARALELRVAQRTHQRVAARGVQGAQALQGREDSSRHLLGELRKAGRARCGDLAAEPAPAPASPEGSARRSLLSTPPGPDGASSSRGALGLGPPGAGRTGRRRAEASCARSLPLPHALGGPGRSGRRTGQCVLPNV